MKNGTKVSNKNDEKLSHESYILLKDPQFCDMNFMEYFFQSYPGEINLRRMQWKRQSQKEMKAHQQLFTVEKHGSFKFGIKPFEDAIIWFVPWSQ